MDHDGLDRLIRSLSTAGSRRRVMGGVLAGGVGVRGWQGQDDAAAHEIVAPMLATVTP